MINEQRKVGIKTIFDLVKQKPIHLILGIVFTSIPFIFVTFFILLISLSASDVPEVDYELVNEKGSPVQGTVTAIEVQKNISLNGEHPRIISYSYMNGDQELNDKFRTLDSARTSTLEAGSSIPLKYFNGQTIITDVKPFSFPTKILSIVLVPFLIIGLITIGLLYWRIRNQIELYKNGKIIDAEIISMTPRSGLPISGIGQKVVVHYQYQITNGQKVLGESATTDYTVLTSKTQGSSVKIFVSRDNETKSCLISKLDDIRNNWKIL